MKSRHEEQEFPGVDPDDLRRAYRDVMAFRFWCLGVGLLLLAIAAVSAWF